MKNQQQQQQQQNINFREKEKQILDKILGPQYYDRRIRPSGANGTGNSRNNKNTHNAHRWKYMRINKSPKS